MDERLTWKEHISDICTKAIKAKAFVRCNLYNCPASLKIQLLYMIIHLLVRSIQEFAAIGPHTHNIRKGPTQYHWFR